MFNYKNPVPHLGGKKWAIQMVFDYDDWFVKYEVKKSLEEWIKENGIPESCISNITPIEEYKNDWTRIKRL